MILGQRYVGQNQVFVNTTNLLFDWKLIFNKLFLNRIFYIIKSIVAEKSIFYIILQNF